MKKLIILLLFCISISEARNSAIIFTVDGLNFPHTILNKIPTTRDNYLLEAIEDMQLEVEDLEIASYNWGGDAKDTDALVLELAGLLRHYYNKAVRNNKKFIVVSHSWGTFLSFAALSFESIKPDPIYCDLYITLCSPLGASNTKYIKTGTELTIIEFTKDWLKKINFDDCNNCTPNVGRWINYWATSDFVSGPMSKYSDKVIDVNIDKMIPLFYRFQRDLVGFIHTHYFAKLDSDSKNKELIKEVKKEICSVVDCNAESSEKKVNLCFILDSSTSMQQNDPKNIRVEAIKSIINQLDGSENIFVIDFDHSSRWINPDNWKNFDKNMLLRQLNSIDSRGNTDIGGGISNLRKILEENKVDKNSAVLLLTDGLGDYNNEAKWFKEKGIPISTVSFVGNDNSVLLKNISSLTGGIYFKANNPNDIVNFYNQFVNQIKGNTTLTVYKSHITQGEYENYRFVIDYTKYIIIMTTWYGSKVGLTLKSPSGKIYSYSNPDGNWSFGSNFVTVKIPYPETGIWEAEFYGDDIPRGGEDYTFNVSSAAEKNIKLQENRTMSSIQFNLESDYSLDEITSANVKVVPPSKKISQIKANLSQGYFEYNPKEGDGNYNFEFSIEGKGFQRFITKTVLIGGEFRREHSVTKFLGQGVFIADFGKNVGAYEGITCYVKNNINEIIAKGYITFLTENESTIEVQQYFRSNIKIGDKVEMDVSQWKSDF